MDRKRARAKALARFLSGSEKRCPPPSPLFLTEIRHFNGVRKASFARFFIQKGLERRVVIAKSLRPFSE